MIQEHSFKVAGRSFAVCFTARARYLFELRAGYPLHELKAFAGAASDVELATLLFAGLEGHRVRSKARKAPWDVDEVLDDVIGDLSAPERLEIQRVCIDAVGAAFEGAAKAAAEAGVAASPEGKAQTTG